MSKRSPETTAADFAEVWSFLKTRGATPFGTGSPGFAAARRIHRAAYSLIIWKFRLNGLPDHSRPFIEELASDALQILPQALLGYGKTVRLMTRGVIENALRHVYFHDHRVEFARMNRDDRWYMGIGEMIDYLGIHPELAATEKRFDAANRLKCLYSELSASVHGRRVGDLEMRAALEKIVANAATVEKHADDIEKCAGAANYLLACFHVEQVRRFQSSDRAIIMRSMPRAARQAWHALLD